MKLTLFTLLAGAAISNGSVLLNPEGGAAIFSDGSKAGDTTEVSILVNSESAWDPSLPSGDWKSSDTKEVSILVNGKGAHRKDYPIELDDAVPLVPVPAVPLPEPSSTALLGLGGLTLLARRKR